MTRTPGGRELLLRTSSGLDLIQWRSPSGIQTHDVGRHLLELPIIEGDPIRVGGQWQNRPNQHGLYFWQRTGQHIWYESALEAACLMALDQAGEVDKIAAQPFRLLFRTDAKRCVTTLTFWRHVVLNEPDATFATNLAFLRSARHVRCHPGPVALEQITNVFAGRRTLGEAREVVNRRSPALAMPAIKHLIWHRLLSVRPDDPEALRGHITGGRRQRSAPIDRLAIITGVPAATLETGLVPEASGQVVCLRHRRWIGSAATIQPCLYGQPASSRPTNSTCAWSAGSAVKRS